MTTGDDATSGSPEPLGYEDVADGIAPVVSRERRDGVEILTLSGELDLHTVEDIAPALEDVLAGRTGSIVIDLAEVTFADSSALNLLLRTHARAALHLAGPLHSSVQRLFEVTGVTGVFNLHDTKDEAIAAAARARP